MPAAALWRWLLATLLGFASGLPLALTGQAMQAWLTADGLTLATIGFLSLVGLPYTLKFLWAPLLDRFELPGTRAALGRRRGWMAASQLALAAGLFALSTIDPSNQLAWYAALAVCVAFLSASQDVVIDAYRTEWLRAHERGIGASVHVMGYRIAMIVSGGLAFIWTDAQRGGGWSWPEVYRLMALLMLGAAAVTVILLPRLAPATTSAAPVRGWRDALGLQTLREGLAGYFQRDRALALLLLIVLYKLGDAFAGSLLTPFLLQGAGFGSAEVGVVNKVIGLWLTLGGALLGGALMLRLGLWRALMLFGVLQMLSNLGFWWLAQEGRGSLGALLLPAFDWGFVKLAQDTPVDGALLLVITLENLSGGMGTAAFVALLMGLCQSGYAATQFALLSALSAVGRVWVGPLAGLLAQAVGWPVFFVISTVAALPALALLLALRPAVQALDVQQPASALDD